ncbi:MAG: glucosaminidase domain-containing protein [Treponema sp.]|nr:glucosaminidase domain-containing protein [Treponema sp.]
MRNAILSILAAAVILASCTTRKEPIVPPEIVDSTTPENIAAVPSRPVTPTIPKSIMGKGLVKAEILSAFLLETNQQADADFVKDLSRLYVEEAAIEGVNHDAAFSQMCLETGYLRFGNLVTPDMNNFCGLGAIDAEHPGERFPTPRLGVRAHIQHLKAYATEEPLKQDLVDPRYKWVKKGVAPTIQGLTGKWATDPDYDKKISSMLTRLYDAAFEK